MSTATAISTWRAQTSSGRTGSTGTTGACSIQFRGGSRRTRGTVCRSILEMSTATGGSTWRSRTTGSSAAFRTPASTGTWAAHSRRPSAGRRRRTGPTSRPCRSAIATTTAISISPRAAGGSRLWSTRTSAARSRRPPPSRGSSRTRREGSSSRASSGATWTTRVR